MTSTALMSLHCETRLHAGAGSSSGIVDLPIQREKHSHWPCIFGSSVKGALRDHAQQAECSQLTVLFGPDTRNASDHAGALSIGDARLLLLPVRSLTTAFRWVTCPEALMRLRRDAERLGVALLQPWPVLEINGMRALTPINHVAALFLEEYRFETQATNELASVIGFLQTLIPQVTVSELQNRLVVVSDDLFGHLCQAAIPVDAHVALDSRTKTVRDKALWFEETLPPETVLYVPVIAQRSRNQAYSLSATEVMALFKDILTAKPWVQIGGNETVGMGWCAVAMLEGGNHGR